MSSEYLKDLVTDWAGNRGISQETLRRMRVTAGTVWFSDGGEQPAVIFGYYEGGRRVNYKARSLTTKQFVQEKPEAGKERPQRFYNLDAVLQGNLDVVYIVEGEMDALALVEAGFPIDSVLSVPGGAPTAASDDPRATRRYAFVQDAMRNGLEKAQKFVLLVDADDKGLFLRQDLAAILGVARTWFCDWPDGIKDANEMLVTDGAQALREYVREAQRPWPVDGLYRLADVPEPPRLELWKVGIPEWQDRVQFAPACLSVGTGYPGHGKTLFSQQIWANIALNYGIKTAIMCAETRIKPHVRRNLRSFYTGYREIEMDQQLRDKADRWIDEHFVFMVHPDSAPTFNWLMDTAEAAVIRYGVRAILADPWNKLEQDFDPREMSETQWIGKCLDQKIHFAKAFNVHWMTLAHPSKPDSMAQKGPPTPYSISGSAHWYNRPDQIWGIHRDKLVGEGGTPSTEATFFQFKTRYEELGFPCKMALKYQPTTGRYYSAEF